MKRILVVFLAALAILTEAGIAEAELIGEAVAVVDNATTEGTVGQQPLKTGMQVSLGDRVTTDGNGEVAFRFKDGTRMVVGPNSSLILDAFVFRGRAADNQFVVRAFSGAFRFITGGGQKDAYLIQTPAATIGVRGTIFDFAVTPGETNLLLLEGGASVCGINGECTLADAQ